MDPTQSSETLTVLYDGDCPLCRREISHVEGLAEARSGSDLCFIDISCRGPEGNDFAADRQALLARFHVPRARQLSTYLERELRSDHAGETGAVCIYQGIIAIARRRKDAELLAFASQHRDTEAEHLRLLEAWLPPTQRSRLLGPWRAAGWLTGALPALFGRRAVYTTIAAVENFVDRHYQQQIDHLECHGGPEGLLALLVRCQADERHHRDEAAGLAGASGPWALRIWCAMVGGGSAAAVMLARRL